MLNDSKQDGVVFYWLSLADLMMIEGFATIVKDNNKPALQEILYKHGFDTTKSYVMDSCTHRRLTGEIHTGPRIIGWERLDRAWKATGLMSKEAQFACPNNPDLQAELMHKSREGFGSVYDTMAERYVRSSRGGTE